MSGVTAARCRACSSDLRHVVVDLGMTPLCESFLTRDQLEEPESFYPLRPLLCQKCFLMQLPEYVSPDGIFSEYAYFSSYSSSWLRHAERYVEAMTGRLSLNKASRVVELASNDGYLLQFFIERGIPVLGVEPAANVAAAAREKGVPTEVAFFGEQTAKDITARQGLADLIVANNVLAQVPDLHDFVRGMKRLLAPGGTITLEFPHLLRLLEGNQFDTIYHEHFSYFSLAALRPLFAEHGLEIHDVEELSTHGGSLRVYLGHAADGFENRQARVAGVLAAEDEAGLCSFEPYRAFAQRVLEIRSSLLEFLIQAKRRGQRVAAYGAPGKGNTLLNYCGIGRDLLEFAVDRNPYKQGRFTPGTHIPILAPEWIREAQPDYLLILPWNLREEIMEQTAYLRAWGGSFIVPIPEVKVY